jgi:hypothetical protein
MAHLEAKHDRSKGTVVETVKRRPTAKVVASDLDATKGNHEPMPQTTEAEDGRESHERVGAVKIGSDNIVDSKGSDFSPGKHDLDLRGGQVSSVANYITEISGNWQRGVDAFMHIARLCAEASVRLTTAQKSKLVTSLPFGEPTFSKFVRIGADTRLKGPEIQQLLPPHYTTMYAVTLLTDQELSRAIGDKVIRPDMKRYELQRWCNSQRERPTKVELVPSSKDTASDSAVVSPPNAQGATESGVFPSALSHHDTQHSLAVQEAVNDQSIAPNENADKTARSINDDGGFERMKAHWEKYLGPDWKDAPEETRARFLIEVLGYSGYALRVHRGAQGQ